MNFTAAIRILMTFCLVTTLCIAGCGGGGEGAGFIPLVTPTPVSTPTQAGIKGFWNGSQGTTSISAIVLGNGESWIVLQENGSVSRFSRAQLNVSNLNFSGSGNQYSLVNGSSIPVTFSGTFSEKSNISGTATYSGGSFGMNLSYNNRYETPASLSDAAGTWKGAYNSKDLNLTVASNGSFNGTSSAGCNYQGELKTRTADNSVFDLSFTENCISTPIKTLVGIATVNETKTNIFFGFTTTDQTSGGLFTGQK